MADAKVSPMTDLEEYRRFVATMAAGDKPSETFSNFSHEHAAVVIAAIFRHARNHVEILTGALDPDVYCTQEVIDAAVAFARQPGASIRVLPERPIAPNHALLAALAAANLRNRISFMISFSGHPTNFFTLSLLTGGTIGSNRTAKK